MGMKARPRAAIHFVNALKAEKAALDERKEQLRAKAKGKRVPRTRIKLNFVVQHRTPQMLHADWISVIHAGLQELGIATMDRKTSEAQYIEGNARINTSYLGPYV